MSPEKLPPFSLDAFKEACVNLLVDLLEAKGCEPAELAEEIGWKAAGFQKRSLDEWLRSPEKTVDECVRVVAAVARSGLPTSEPMSIPADFGRQIYTGRPAEEYAVAVEPSFVHEVWDTLPDSTSQKLRLLYASLQCTLDRVAQDPGQAAAVVKALEDYLRLAKERLDFS